MKSIFNFFLKLYNRSPLLSHILLYFALYLAFLRILSSVFATDDFLFGIFRSIIGAVAAFVTTAIIIIGYKSTCERMRLMYIEVMNTSEYRYAVAKYALLFLFAVYIHGNVVNSGLSIDSASPIIQTVSSFWQFIVLSMFLLYALYNSIDIIKSRLISLEYSNLFKMMFISVAIYQIGFDIILLYGDYLIAAWVSETQENQILILFSLVMFMFIYGLFQAMNKDNSSYMHEESSKTTLGIAANKRDVAVCQMTESEVRSVSLHESGHLLTYAALGALDPYVMVKVNNTYTRYEPMGYVVSPDFSRMTLKNKAYFEWNMLCYLSGFVVERLYQCSALGSGADMRNWEEFALKYAREGFLPGYRFIASTDNCSYDVVVHELNCRLLAQLRCDQEAQLEAFFRRNEQILIEVARRLYSEKSLNYGDLVPLLDRVDVSNMPKPLGDFNHFNEVVWQIKVKQSQT